MIKTFSVGHACVAVWYGGKPTLADCQEAFESVSRHCAITGQRAVLVSVLAPSVLMPDVAVADQMRKTWPSMLGMAAVTQYVVMPRGFVAARLLTMLSVGFGLAFRGHDVRVSQALSAVNDLAKDYPKLSTAEIVARIEQTIAKVSP
jgi:hypothetical protein